MLSNFGGWRRLLRVPWTARKSNQSILKENSPEYSLEGLVLKLQYFGHLKQRASSLEMTLMLGENKERRRRGPQRMRCWMASLTHWTWGWASSRRRWRTGKPDMPQSVGLQSRTRLSNCTTWKVHLGLLHYFTFARLKFFMTKIWKKIFPKVSMISALTGNVWWWRGSRVSGLNFRIVWGMEWVWCFNQTWASQGQFVSKMNSVSHA